MIKDVESLKCLEVYKGRDNSGDNFYWYGNERGG